MKTLAILQARVSSSRLPGKVLFPLLGKPMLLRHIERLKRCEEMDQLLVATSIEISDDPLAEACQEQGIAVFRGSLNDVLDRFIQAALPYQPDTIVRLTGDCPLADPVIIDATIRYFYAGNYDYVSNCLPPTFPDGLDVEVMRYSALQEAAREATLPSQREHVTPFLRAHPQRYRLGNFSSETDYSKLRWTVDEPEDYEFVCQVYECLYPANPNFSMHDILELMQKAPELQAINAAFKRNEGSKKSLLADAEFLARKS